jgi:photolyase PhrII
LRGWVENRSCVPYGAAMLEVLHPWLRERCRSLGPLPDGDALAPDESGPIVYWMRVAVRDHENPALDVALSLALAYKLPVLVYHALSERYPYASDRHHTFILEGARDVSAALAARGIPYAFHLESSSRSEENTERQRGEQSVLRQLARSARVVVTELMPVAPLRGWTAEIAKCAPVIEVDASCIYPMTHGLSKAPERAFEFRKATEKTMLRTLELGYPSFECAGEREWRAPDSVTFSKVELALASIPALVAGANIDHGIGPVADSPGGMVAGYRRWSHYLERDLHRYAATRNDPLQDTTSRMSPYLHYGQVSPFRLARDLFLRAKGDPSAQKLLDELLVWRELGFHYCYHKHDVHSVASLPAWARATLRTHEKDPRILMPSWEQLTQARTGDALWDACQRSLLAHGELHNNVRMTWGKKLLEWTERAQDALSLLIDLNHRYALDGRDPSSYAGIHWCFGAFDRSFTPELPLLGTVRPRPTDVHLERLNLVGYEKFVGRAPYKRSPRIAVLGSGVSGLAIARTLHAHNLNVSVFDKGRRPGGRLVSRALEGVVFDYGAQYFTAHSEAFQRLAGALAWEDVLAVWSPRMLRLEMHEAQSAVQAQAPAPQSAAWYVAPLGFSAFAKRLAEGLNVQQSAHVTRILAEGTTQRLVFEDETTQVFDHVLVTLPAPQAQALVGAPLAHASGYAPCWSLTMAFDRSTNLSFDAAEIDSDVLAWAARETSKPGRTGSVFDVWTVHANTKFSEAFLEAPEEEVQEKMQKAFRSLGVADDVSLVSTHLHKWRFARALSHAVSLYHHTGNLGAAGDGFGGPRVESAYLSGVALAGDLLRQLALEGAGSRRV